MLKAGFASFETYEGGKYPAVLMEVKAGERLPFGVKDGEGSKEACFDFVFECAKLKRSDGEPARFVVRTGFNYGSGNAMLTKVVDGVTGSTFDASEIDRLDLSRLTGARVDLLVALETSATGKVSNKVVQITPFKGYTGHSKELLLKDKDAGSKSKTSGTDTDDEIEDPFA